MMKGMKIKGTLLIAVLLITTLAMMPLMTASSYTEQEDGKGEVDLSTEQAYSGIYSMRLELPAGIINEDEARIKFDYYKKLDSLETISYMENMEGTVGILRAPYVTATIDRDDDGAADAWLVHIDENLPDYEWHGRTLDEQSLFAVAKDQLGADWEIPTDSPITLSILKDTIVNVETGKTWGDCLVQEVKVGHGTCGAGVDPSFTLIAFVDDVTITDIAGEVTYDFDPTIVLDAEFYHIGDTVTMTVTDIYANKKPDSREIIWSHVFSDTMPDDIDIVLKETGVDTGIFTGTFKLVDVTPSTGELVAADGDTITASYLLPSISDTAKVDDTAPVVEITAPLDDAFVSGEVSIDATTTDTHPIDVLLEIDGEEVEDPEFPCIWITDAMDGEVPLCPDGAYTITVTATDEIGNIGSNSISVTVDNTVPEIANALVTPATVYPDTAATFVFTAEVSDLESGVYTVEIDLEDIGPTLSMLDDGESPDETEDDGIYTTSYETTGLSAKTYPLTITATDKAGNSFTTNPEDDLVTDDITIVSSTDLVKPVITGESITYPVGVVSARQGDQIVISAIVTDDVEIGSIAVIDDLETPLIELLDETLVDLEEDGTYTVTIDPIGLFVPGSYVLTITATDINANSETATVTLEVTTDLTGLYVDLEEGWNLFSLPLMPDDSSIEVVLADVMEDVEIVWGYKDGVWSKYLPGLPEFSALTDLVDGEGYWVLMNADDTVTVSGVELPGPGILPPVYDVVEGWNLIGFKSVESMNITNYLTTIPNDVKQSAVSYGWNAGVQDYELVYLGDFDTGFTEFNPGQGYWLYLIEDACIAPPTG